MEAQVKIKTLSGYDTEPTEASNSRKLKFSGVFFKKNAW